MKFDARVWQKLQFPVLMLALVLIIVFMLLWFTGSREALLQEALSKQEAELRQARSRYLDSGAEKDAITKYLPLYRQLIEHGFIGEERRIEWIDELRNINQKYKLFGINYSIGTQENFKPQFQHNAGNFVMHRSVMEIDSALLHELDLLTILSALEEKHLTPFMVRECEITRIGTDINNKFLPNLNARCELDWLTLTEPPQSGGKP